MHHKTVQLKICSRCDKIEIPDRILSRMVDRAMIDRSSCEKSNTESTTLRLNSTEPRCFAPHVDVTHARQAYGRLALPKLTRELHCQDGNIVRQAVTSIADISVNPEEIAPMIELRITESLADFLLFADSYVRERVAIIYGTISRQAVGREAIFRCTKILCNLSKGLSDPLATVRIKMARVIKSLALHPIVSFGNTVFLTNRAQRLASECFHIALIPAKSIVKFTDGENLCARGFLEMLVGLLETEKNNTILAVHLECLESLLNGRFRIRAVEINTVEKLVSMLSSDDEAIVAGALSCLSVVSQEPMAKQKSIELDILRIMKKLLHSPIRSVYKKATAIVMFATTTTLGKLRALALEIIDKLVELASDASDPELQINSMQALSNIVQLPAARSIILEEHSMYIEDIDSRKDKSVERHKNILLNIIRARP